MSDVNQQAGTELRSIPGAKLAQTVHIRQHAFVTDIGVADGGEDAGPNPHELYDAALGACKSLTVLWYARRKGIPVTDVHSTVTHDASEERKGLYRMRVNLSIAGDLSDAHLAELLAVAEKCPVHKLMTAVKTEIATTVARAEA